MLYNMLGSEYYNQLVSGTSLPALTSCVRSDVILNTPTDLFVFTGTSFLDPFLAVYLYYNLYSLYSAFLWFLYVLFFNKHVCVFEGPAHNCVFLDK